MPLFLTIWLTKSVLKLSRMFRRGGGSALPGLIGEKLDPNLSRKLTRRVPLRILATGTNGKTTATSLLVAGLRAAGMQVLTNASGSNLSRGIAASLIEHANLWGRVRADVAVFEVDEASLPGVAAQVLPQEMVVLNIFRDQLDRYGELDKTASLIGGAIAASQARLHLNADDPLVAGLSQYAKADVCYFGAGKLEQTKLGHDHAADSNHCPVCGEALDYQRTFFGHIGHYACPKGHFNRPRVGVELTEFKSQGLAGSQLKVTLGSAKQTIALPLPGLYNAYNALAAVSVADFLGVDLAAFCGALNTASAAFGRVENFSYRGRQVYLLLIKNPTGFNQVIQTFLTIEKNQSLMIAVNDNFADGRDVSWLWDVAFEELRSQKHQLVASGIRGADLALCLKYAEVDVAKLEPDLNRAFEAAVVAAPEGGNVFVLPTYTAMLSLRAELVKVANLKGFWE